MISHWPTPSYRQRHAGTSTHPHAHIKIHTCQTSTQRNSKGICMFESNWGREIRCLASSSILIMLLCLQPIIIVLLLSKGIVGLYRECVDLKVTDFLQCKCNFLTGVCVYTIYINTESISLSFVCYGIQPHAVYV